MVFHTTKSSTMQEHSTFFNPNFFYTFLSFLRTPYSLTSFPTLIAQEAGLNDTRFLSLLYGNDTISSGPILWLPMTNTEVNVYDSVLAGFPGRSKPCPLPLENRTPFKLSSLGHFDGLSSVLFFMN
ncbi:hypothetical protein RO3G_06391 [Rhizopus delemar RA 99-880]|uniref:Uncharacterized protein n=1 Tax=Rhizopus delemar (strain RA 99-880 / ATCC MYA-4621 / FGSC 9543 / NRRL 43880) TaxID=246409 RepID=I1BZQ6_RHIO9|nr:hypothetical protein RO3G_06391 [Rhizopus delemar RA 99-880]|eukprot:EIE81686.1 hypothetical protein RO3G_06391 [Rhizopus delemar RA 99-880]